jgi:hypothetical protein
MPMMGVWKMRLMVDEFLMAMRMRVGFTRRVPRGVGVLVMVVVPVQMLVFHWNMSVHVVMALGEM